jgi:myo-inositol-1(or 4)-monophosphatase
MTDRELAEQVVRTAARIALERRGESLTAVAKESPADVATDVDREAEHAADRLIAEHRPHDGIEGEEGARREGRRRWVVDALDGTLNYLNGLPGWCAAVALEGPEGTQVAAVYDPVRDELFTAARGEGTELNGVAARVTAADSLDTALIATFLHQPKIHLPGVLPTLTRLLETAGSVRMTGSGTLELAYVAAGRLHGWIQPAVYRWDWLPGALLVEEAGGIAVSEQGWNLAGEAMTVERLRPAVWAGLE